MKCGSGGAAAAAPGWARQGKGIEMQGDVAHREGQRRGVNEMGRGGGWRSGGGVRGRPPPAKECQGDKRKEGESAARGAAALGRSWAQSLRGDYRTLPERESAGSVTCPCCRQPRSSACSGAGLLGCCCETRKASRWVSSRARRGRFAPAAAAGSGGGSGGGGPLLLLPVL
jgi:hypothetical protein